MVKDSGTVDVLRADVAVVGAGGAGLLAAHRAREGGVEVALLGKAPTGRGTCTAMAAGIFSAPTARFPEEAHREATLEAGRGINDHDRVDQVVGAGRAAIEDLRRAGAPFEEIPTGWRVVPGERPVVPGVRLVEWLRRRVRSAGVREVGVSSVLDVVVEDGELAGVLGAARDGRPFFVEAPAVVLATGGAAALYLRHDNPPGITGDGYGLALRAGCALRDMEFVQFYPVGLAEPGLPTFMVYPPYPPGARVVDRDGRDVLADLGGCRDLGDAIVRFRDTAALLFQRLHEAGGAFLDFSGVDPGLWDSDFCLRRLARSSFDFRGRRCRIAPVAHFTIGGVVVDAAMATSVPGLYAAGEVVGGLHGANRLGGNALTECVVCGPIAGERAAAHSRRVRPRHLAAARLRDRLPPGFDAGDPRIRPEYNQLLHAIRTAAWNHAGIVRYGDGLRRGLGALARLRGDLASLQPRGPAEATRHHGLRSALLTLHSILEGSRLREESRGALFRADYPDRDDENWRRNLQVRLDPSGALTVESS